MNLSDIRTLNIKGSDYHCIMSRTSKNDSINLMQNVDLIKKSVTLQNINFFIIYKNG